VAVRVMGIGAHPDDLEILCGGTLARFVAQGHPVVMCHLARGDRGSFVHTRSESASMRDVEARQAAQLIGAECLALGIPDGEVNGSDPEQRRLVTEAIRKARPDMILAHSPNDYMTDHVEASKLAYDTSFLATLPLFETESAHIASVPALVYMDTVSGNLFSPTEYVDISDFIETKTAMFSQHASQLAWLSEHDGVDMLEQIRVTARFRGLQCGVRHAEAFAPCNAWLRARAERLLP
jgi:LmbE family N-acetylglucosaminyl deacetylase